MATTYQPTQWLIPNNDNTDKVGNYSFQFAGVGDYIDCGNGDNLQITGAMTISYWFKGEGTTSTPSGVGKLGGTRGYSLGIDNGAIYSPLHRISFYIAPTSSTIQSVSYDVAIDTSLWYHVVGVYIPSTSLTIYLNGVKVKENLTAISASQYSASNTFKIGTRGDLTYLFTGSISEVSIFDYALTSGNITTLYGDATNGVGNPMGLDPVPVGYWKGDRATLGAQWNTPNQVSQDYAFDFNGTSDYINCGNDNSLLGNSDFTISAWVNVSAWTGYGGIALRGIFGTGYGLFLNTGAAPTTLAFQVREGGNKITLYTDSNVALDTWYHFVGVRVVGGTSYIYLNGVAQASTDSESYTISNSDDFEIGITGAFDFDGLISNVAFWDSALDAPTIASIYNNGTPGDLTSLSPVSWWKLDDSATFSTNWSIPDAGSESNTGTSSGMTGANLVPATITRGTAMYSNYSFLFDGVDDYVQFGDVSLSGAFSVSAWVRLTNGSVSNEVLLGDTANDDWLRFDSDVRVKIKIAGTSIDIDQGSSTFFVDQWFHFAATRNGSDVITLYKNGSALSTTGTLAGTFVPERIGKKDTGYFLEGNILDVALWSDELSAANILAIYNNGRPGNLTSLSPIHWWRMGEEAFAGFDPGTGLRDTVWIIPDQTGSNDGTGSGAVSPWLVGEAPQSYANGLSVSMNIYDRKGESGFSNSNGLSYNMDSEARKEDVPA